MADLNWAQAVRRLPELLSGRGRAAQALRKIGDLAPKNQVFLVGGLVRDLLLGRPVKEPLEVDLAAPALALDLAERAAREAGGRMVVLSERDETARIIFPGLIVDLASFRRPDLASDLSARDFTINALAVPLEAALAGEPADLIDPTGGLADLAAGRIRLAGPMVLAQDPLRILRGIRLAAELGFSLLPETRRAFWSAGPGLVLVAGERIGQELSRLLLTGNSAAWFRLMAEDKLLGLVLPEAAALSGLYQNRYHHLDGLGHTLLVLEKLEKLLSGRGPASADPAGFGAEPGRLLALKLAALLHDAGKIGRMRIRPDGRIAFPGHQDLSAELTILAAGRLALPREAANQAADLIRLHMRPLNLLLEPDPSERSLRRLVLAAGDLLPDLGLLALADSLATRGPWSDPGLTQRLLGLWDRLAEVGRLARGQAGAPLLNGRDLMSGLGLGPGPLVGRLLAELAEARLGGLVNDRAGALAWAGRRLKELSDSPA